MNSAAPPPPSSSDGMKLEQSNARTIRLWIGLCLWSLVIAVAVWKFVQPNPSKPHSATDGRDDQRVEESDESGIQKQIRLKTTKEGGIKVVDGSSKPVGPVWDEDGIADFEFTNVDGKKVTKADLLGRPWIVCFVFTHCAYSCPMVTNSMRELQDRLKAYDFRLVTLTVDPERDTLEVLKGYGESRGANFEKWLFLRGEQKAVYTLIHGSFKMPVQETFGKDRRPGFEFIHSNNIMLVDDAGVVRGKFDATKGEAMSDLRHEIQKMAKRVTSDGEVDQEESSSSLTDLNSGPKEKKTATEEN